MGTSDRVFEGKDLEEALLAASAELRIPEPDLDYEILEQGRRGLFGIGARNVCIRVMPPVDELTEGDLHGEERPPDSKREPRPVKSAHKPRHKPNQRPSQKPKPESRPAPPDGANGLANDVQRMLDLMGLELSVNVQPLDSGVNVELRGRDRKALTHKDGELISALQFLLNRMARRAWPGTGRIHLSCDGDRKQRDEELVDLVREVAQQVLHTGRTKRLHPMNAYERRLVHITVREQKALGSRSEGSGHQKRVRIYKQKK